MDKRFEVSVEIAATPERVWSVLTDVDRWPDWTASMRQVRRLDSGPFTVGSTARIQQPRLPTVVWRVTELTPQRSFVWVAGNAGVTTAAGHHIVPLDGPGVRVELDITQTGPLAPMMGWLTGSLTRRYMRMEADGLKRRCEQTGSA